MTSNLDRLATLRAVHLAAYGDTPHPILNLIDAATASGSEAVAASVAEHVAASAPSEAKGLAAVAKELDADRRPPSLWLSVDISNEPVPVSGSLYDTFKTTPGAVGMSWSFRRENAAHVNGRPLAARLLVPAPGGIPSLHLSEAARWLRDSAAHVQVLSMRDDSRRAAMSAAVERSAPRKAGA